MVAVRLRGDRGAGMTSERTRARMIDRLRERGIRDEAVLKALAAVPRHVFIDEALAHRAYEDTALPLGCGQTISQPYVVARAISLLRAGRESRLKGGLGKTLEIGAGCGYQAAVLGCLTPDVYAVERIRELIERAKVNLRTIQQFNVRLKFADGNLGVPEAAPFDTIISAAASAIVPPVLLQQLNVGGRILLPLGGADQQLVMFEQTEKGLAESRFDAVRFVPLLQGTQ
ncbi:MAG TPA: protein-L-isoaspartate(D-aspartate) O-methyltransferase [Rhodocyclaceae bacterium]